MTTMNHLINCPPEKEPPFLEIRAKRGKLYSTPVRAEKEEEFLFTDFLLTWWEEEV